MKIYTSYFANYRNFGTLVPIAVSRSVPPGYSGLRFIDLAPSWTILEKYKSDGNQTIYKSDYFKQLSNLNQLDVLDQLGHKSNGKDIVLLCYEKKGSFCHRNFILEWLKQSGIEAEEL